MKTYYFFYKNTPNDILGKFKAYTLIEAVERAAYLKQLPIKEFNEIFEVKEYGGE